MSREPLLARWSRRKLSVRGEDPVEPASPTAAQGEDPVEPAPPVGPETPTVRPELPPLDSISLDTGIAAFFRPGVEEGLRRLALKKLFSDPHFNVMDGLDVYIDDYSKWDPIPPDILERLVQAQTLLHDQDVGSMKAGEMLPQSNLSVADTAVALGSELPPDTEDPLQVGGQPPPNGQKFPEA